MGGAVPDGSEKHNVRNVATNRISLKLTAQLRTSEDGGPSGVASREARRDATLAARMLW